MKSRLAFVSFVSSFDIFQYFIRFPIWLFFILLFHSLNAAVINDVKVLSLKNEKGNQNNQRSFKLF